MNISINPALTTNVGEGMFRKTSNGVVQGMMMDDPSSRNWISGGVVGLAETLPMWGGILISENIPLSTAGVTTPSETLGGYIKRATNVTANAALSATGFTVFNQLYNAINSPGSPVGVVGPGMGVNFLRFGSQARLAVACDAALVNLDGGIISPLVSWDYGAQKLAPYQAAYAANVITNAVWSGGQITFTTTTAHGLSVGSDVTISGFTPAAYNGTYKALAGTTGSTIVVAKTVDPGADTVQGQLDAGGGALPVKVLEIIPEGNMIVAYDSATNFATWDTEGPAAVILLS